MPKTLLVDGNALMHRAYHSVQFAPLYNGIKVGMVFGVASGVLQSLETFSPDFMAVAFDTKEKTFRHEMDEAYKAHRQKAPDDFYPQLPFIEEFLSSFGIPIFKKPGFEADDIVGTLAQKSAKKEYETLILSHDLDYCQLLSPYITICRSTGKFAPEYLLDAQKAETLMGVCIDQLVDYKALVGDSSDNYKGVDGIGPKGAANLLKQFPHLEALYENLDQLNPKIKQKLLDQKDYLFHCRTLARIRTDVSVDFDFETPFQIQFEKAQDFLERFRFPSLQKRLQFLNKKNTQNKKEDQDLSSIFSFEKEEKEQLSLF